MAYLLGGKQEWLGKTMKQAHQSFYITGEEFDLMMSLMRNALSEAHIKQEH
jgi:truncated hemoglobin YjbI